MKFSVNQKIISKNYPDKEAIPDGSVGKIFEICNNETVLENFNQPMYLVKFNGIKHLIPGMGSWMLEEEIEAID